MDRAVPKRCILATYIVALSGPRDGRAPSVARSATTNPMAIVFNQKLRTASVLATSAGILDDGNVITDLFKKFGKSLARELQPQTEIVLEKSDKIIGPRGPIISGRVNACQGPRDVSSRFWDAHEKCQPRCLSGGTRRLQARLADLPCRR